MKRKILWVVIFSMIICIVGCSKEVKNDSNQNEIEEATFNENENKTIKIIDKADREVEIPVEINKVYCTSPTAMILMYTIDSNLLVGGIYEPSELELKYLDDVFCELPILGGWYGKGNDANYEEILKAKPDIILNVGDITEETVEFSDKIQEQLGIPTVIVESDIFAIEDTYRFLGEILGREDRTNQLVEYIVELLNDVEEKKSLIKEEDIVSVYYAEGDVGLETDPKGSRHSEIIEIVGAKNVADGDTIDTSYGRQTISIEQLLEWNPELILVSNNCVTNPTVDSAYDVIMSDSIYETIDAVKNNQVYQIPHGPFNWFDRPPSVNRLLGIKWTANIIYPEIYDYDMEEEMKTFYSLFYRYDLTDEDIEELLEKAR